LRVGVLTREFPPEVYGGAGVHVENLCRELAELVDVDVHCFGAERDSPLVRGTYPFPDPSLPAGTATPLHVMSVDVQMAARLEGVDLVHSHTWYANFAGHLAKLVHRVPHVLTTHSLEPMRPWKADQLGSGYGVSMLCEKAAIEVADAVIAVSGAMAEDVAAAYPAVDSTRVTVIHNGIDPDEYQPDPATDVLDRLGVDPDRPTVVWVGRVTPQKGVGHLLDMAARLPADAQFVFLAGAADTPEFGAETRARAAEVATTHRALHWIEGMLPKHEVIQLLGHSTVFVCPSVYEPFGLVNLEAMACGLPVVATAIGGIPEIVVDSVTGYLVPLAGGGGAVGEALAALVGPLLDDPARAREMGAAGRARVVERFTWRSVAARTAELYASLI
jgi:alpha-maltose-1-phosphate synthase